MHITHLVHVIGAYRYVNRLESIGVSFM